MQIQGKQRIVSDEHRHLILFKVSDGTQAFLMGLKGGTWEGRETCTAPREQLLTRCSTPASQGGLLSPTFVSSLCCFLEMMFSILQADAPTECKLLSPDLAWGLAGACTWQRFCIPSWNEAEAKISALGFQMNCWGGFWISSTLIHGTLL